MMTPVPENFAVKIKGMRQYCDTRHPCIAGTSFMTATPILERNLRKRVRRVNRIYMSALGANRKCSSRAIIVRSSPRPDMLAQTENTPRGATLPRQPRIPNLSGMLLRSPATEPRPPGYIEPCIPALAASFRRDRYGTMRSSTTATASSSVSMTAACAYSPGAATMAMASLRANSVADRRRDGSRDMTAAVGQRHRYRGRCGSATAVGA
jgi:hypothetical protein